MSSLLELATEFLDRMTNPAYGADVNEEYALRLARLLDGALAERLASEAQELRTPDALTPHAWTWLLGWAKSAGTALDPELLLALCEQWESATFKAAVIEAAIVNDSGEPSSAGVRDVPDVRDFPNPWLRTLLTRATHPDVEPTRADSKVPLTRGYRHSRHVQSLLNALLLVERDVTVRAAAALLREPWEGQRALLEAFWARIESLDPETREVWLGRLQPPPLFR